MTHSTAEILAIGNEILIGEIQDTNTSWLCALVNGRGGRVVRGAMLRDDPDEIAAEVRRALKRGPDVIFTSGGLGPTADDLTLAAVADGAGLPLLLHHEALDMVREQYDRFHAEGIMAQGGLNPAREKMAWMPRGAMPIRNPVGTAPAMLLHAGRTAIVSLPGVPSELKAILTVSLRDFMDRIFGRGGALCRTLRVRCNDESLLEPVLSHIVPRHPEVYIKSLASTVGRIQELDILLSATGDGREDRENLVAAALDELREGLTGAGIVHHEPRPEEMAGQ